MGEDLLTDRPDDIPLLADTSGMKQPSTARGARTRAALVAAARRVFERDGFLGARITDIPAEANCATGTFYKYFSSKEEIFTAVLEAAQDDMLHPGMPHADGDDPIAVIEASNRAYLVAFLRNAKLMELMQQVALIDPKFRELRRRRGAIFAERNARRIAELQERGLADPTLDPLLTSMALSGMVSRIAMDVLVPQLRELDEVVEVVTKLWVNGLKLTPTS
ncbi:TetR/AcrR family transcriptional regulator [Thermopolyspora sp. NPDC052614]|uniref:TetR/AcrR family transcriptional regulator n=1 Tax=Thermopolyspora sp. NPDC052614 TaxID=3155682 RepID=UPI00343FDFAA